MKGLTPKQHTTSSNFIQRLEDIETLEGIDTSYSSIPTHDILLQLEDIETLEGIDTVNWRVLPVLEQVRRYRNP